MLNHPFLSISWVKFDPYIPYLGMDITSLPSGPKKRREALSTAKPKTPEPGCQAARLSRTKGDPWWPRGIGNMSNNVSCHLRIACISCITSQDRSGFSSRWLRFCHDSSPVFGGSPLAGLNAHDSGNFPWMYQTYLEIPHWLFMIIAEYGNLSL